MHSIDPWDRQSRPPWLGEAALHPTGEARISPGRLEVGWSAPSSVGRPSRCARGEGRRCIAVRRSAASSTASERQFVVEFAVRLGGFPGFGCRFGFTFQFGGRFFSRNHILPQIPQHRKSTPVSSPHRSRTRPSVLAKVPTERFKLFLHKLIRPQYRSVAKITYATA